MKTVVIATPAYEGTVGVRYVDSLIQTLRTAPQDVGIFPLFLPGDALVQRARNSLCGLALSAFEGKGVDDVVFIDADMFWNPGDFHRLLSHDVDVIGGLCRQAQDAHVLTFRPRKNAVVDDKGLLEVESTGCGFLRLRRRALERLWAKSRAYKDGPVTMRSVFEVTIEYAELLSEDISMCHKWRNMGGKVYVDTALWVGHMGSKAYVIEPPKVELPKLALVKKNEEVSKN